MLRLLGVAALAARKTTMGWLIHLGGPGLILLGLLDNSVIPLPGSMDVATILLAAHSHHLWFYYSIMATAGSVLGGYLTYRMARKGGKEAVEKKLSKNKAVKVYAIFERWGFAAVAIPAMLPPPFPIVAMLLAAGAMQYPTKKFLGALTVGRAARYGLLGFLGAHYGRGIIKFFSKYYVHTLVILIVFSVAAALYGYWEYRRRQKGGGSEKPAASTRIRRRTA
jgi:membrane protein YqaA with SNARE-associated domain